MRRSAYAVVAKRDASGQKVMVQSACLVQVKRACPGEEGQRGGGRRAGRNAPCHFLHRTRKRTPGVLCEHRETHDQLRNILHHAGRQNIDNTHARFQKS